MYMWYAIVCSWCKKQLELKGTNEEHMNEKISHTICESCLAKVMAEIEA